MYNVGLCGLNFLYRYLPCVFKMLTLITTPPPVLGVQIVVLFDLEGVQAGMGG